ncbi:hypothetical protein BDD12DRAFT_883241 [Trichophaea hybrida]|nr:hypothetical protein BDD12DRAFT_883241 [Trichophaea hybrida]
MPQSTANDGTEIDEKKVKQRIYLKESRETTYAITETETNIIIHRIWYLGLSVANIHRTYRETEEMIENNQQVVPILTTCFSGILDAFMNHTGAWDAVAEHGLYPENHCEDVEEKV